jgi:ATP-dependent helicase/nuclease subunit A
VLDWVNAVFDHARAEGRYPLYETQTTALGGPAGPVWLLPLVEPEEAEDDEASEGDGHRDTLTQPRTQKGDSLRYEEGRRVAAWLHYLRDQVPVSEGDGTRPAGWRDMHLLVRRKTFLADYERAMREAGIPCLSPRRGGC